MYYKVVRQTPKGLYSALETKVEAEYKIGEFITASYPLFIFGNLQMAKEYEWSQNVYLDQFTSVYKCEARNVRGILVALYIDLIDNHTFLKRFWESSEVTSGLVTCVPRGTLICDAVKLTGKVT